MPEFEWDQAKSAWNERERGFDFDYASRIFRDSVVEKPDRRRAYGEERIIATGRVDDELYTVVYTLRAGRRRIISARRANRRERHAYRSTYP